jgi:hypothetical protein
MMVMIVLIDTDHGIGSDCDDEDCFNGDASYVKASHADVLIMIILVFR